MSLEIKNRDAIKNLKKNLASNVKLQLQREAEMMRTRFYDKIDQQPPPPSGWEPLAEVTVRRKRNKIMKALGLPGERAILVDKGHLKNSFSARGAYEKSDNSFYTDSGILTIGAYGTELNNAMIALKYAWYHEFGAVRTILKKDGTTSLWILPERSYVRSTWDENEVTIYNNLLGRFKRAVDQSIRDTVMP